MKKRFICILSLMLCCVLFNASLVNATRVNPTKTEIGRRWYNGGDTATVSWQSGDYLCVYLKNISSGNETPEKSGTHSLRWTNLRPGYYIIYARSATGATLNINFTY